MEIISGSEIAGEIKERMLKDNQNDNIRPVLAVIVVGDDKESLVYVGLKEKAVTYIGGETRYEIMPTATTREVLLDLINNLNKDPDVDGILLQLPLPEGLEAYQEGFLEAISPAKDVDGFNPVNRGKLTGNNPEYISCAALACMEVIEKYTTSLKDKNIILCGDSFDLIIPLAAILISRGSKITIVPEYDAGYAAGADIIVVEKGAPGIVKGEQLKKGTILIDAGFYWDYDRISGNVDRSSVQYIEGYLLPVPGGLGPLLIAKLTENLNKAARRNKK